MTNEGNRTEPTAEKIIRIIFQALSAIVVEPDIDRQLLLLADLGREVTVADRCSVWIWEKPSAKLWTTVAHGIDRITVPDSTGIVGAAARSGENIIINEPYSDPRFDQEVDSRSGYVTRNILAIPFRDTHGQVCGVFQAINKMSDTQGFTATDVERSFLVAAYIGKQLETTLLHEEIARSKEDLRRSEENLTIILEATNDGFWDLHPDQSNLFASVKWCEKMLGTTEPSSFELLARKGIHPEDIPRLREAFFPHLLGLTPDYEVEYRFLTHDKSWIWVEERGRITERNKIGDPLRLVGTFRDVTARRAAQEEQEAVERKVLHVQRLESLGIMAGGIAHDFNNFLTTILGNSEVLLLDIPPDSGKHQFVREIRDAAIRSSELTRQLLAYSGKGKFLVEYCNLSSVIRETVELVRVSISKKAQLSYDLRDDLPDIEADLGQLRQIVMNLVINGSDALQDCPGTILVQTDLKPYTPAEFNILGPGEAGGNEEPFVVLRVRDSGIGMDEETRNRIFDPFFSTKNSGRGLGLAAVLGIVRGHGGILGLESSPGAGTIFSVGFPQTRRGKAGGTDEHPGPGSGGADTGPRLGTILVVDDEISVRILFQRVLEKVGYSVILAANGAEGVESFRRLRPKPDLVILDLSMPEMNGLEVLEKLRHIDETVPIVMMSGYSNSPIPAGGPKPEAFLPKPCPRAVLLQTILDVLGH